MINGILCKLREKLAECDGETLVETLVSTLIIAAVMLMLCTAIVSAAKVNTSARGLNTAFDESSAVSVEVTITVSHPDTKETDDTYTSTTTTKQIIGYTQNGYVSYVASK